MESTKNRVKTNVWFFVGKSIGVTLLGLYALEQARLRLVNQEVQLFLVYSRRSHVCKAMLSQYPHITFVYLEQNEWKGLGRLLLQKLFENNIFLYPPSFGRAPLSVRIFSHLLTLFNPQSQCVAALPEKKLLDNVLFTKVLPLDLERSIFFSSADMVGHGVDTMPELLFSYDADLQKKLPEKYIVFHPFAANEGRTYPDSLSRKLLAHLLNTYPRYTIVISGSSSDQKRAGELIEGLSSVPSSIKLIHEYLGNDFVGTPQILSDAQLYIGVDTGITHVAAHLNVPSVILGNRSNPMWLPTYSSRTDILYNAKVCTCTADKKGNCLKEIDGKLYYRCMVDISWQSLCSAIELRLNA